MPEQYKCKCGMIFSPICGNNSCFVCQDYSRDINHVFKFKIGMKVEKKWRWKKNQLSRDSNNIPIGSTGVVREVNPESGDIGLEDNDGKT